MGNAADKENKEKVLHTRISKSLDEFIKEKAKELRIPVSNLVRNILEETADLHKHMSEVPPELIRNFKQDARELQDTLAEIPPEFRRSLKKKSAEFQEQIQSMQIKLLNSLREEAEKIKDQVESIPPKITRSLERDLKPQPQTASGAVEDSEGSTAGRDSNETALLDRILGWQALKMNKSVTCARCGSLIEKGASGHLGIGEPGDPKVFICDPCAETV